MLFWAAASMGLMWQLCLLLKQYFDYRVSIQTTIITRDAIDNLDISVCVQSRVVLNYDKLYLNTGRKWTLENTTYKDLHNLTVAETMEYTLDGYDLLDNIFLPTRSTSVWLRRRDTRSHAVFTKFLYQAYVCYKVSILSRDVTLQELPGGVIKEIGFKGIEASMGLYITLSLTGKYPYNSIFAARYIHRGENSSMNFYRSSHYTTLVDALPAPYETDCYDYTRDGFHDEAECRELCFANRTFDLLGKLPESTLITQSSNLSILEANEYDEKDNDLIAVLNQIRSNCSLYKCHKKACHTTHISTVSDNGINVVLSEEDAADRVISWQHIVPNQPSFEIRCRATTSFIDLLLFILSCVSSWTGLSVLSLSPRKVWAGFEGIVGLVIVRPNLRKRLFIPMLLHERVTRLEDLLVSQTRKNHRLRQISAHHEELLASLLRSRISHTRRT